MIAIRRLMLTILLLAPAALLQAVEVRDLRCEYRRDPQGIDVGQPRLSWEVEAEGQRPEVRGQRQTAYQVLVASTPELLAKDKGDLWDSGVVPSDRSVHVEYAGKPLESRGECFWKVRVWDEKGTASAWSPSARWSMGLLAAGDWQAQWISDPVLADPANRPLTPIHCYRSELACRPDAAKWIVVDLCAAKRLDAVDVIPARPRGQGSDSRTVMFPERFKIEVADTKDFNNARTVVDRTQVDVPSPRANQCRFSFTAVTASFVAPGRHSAFPLGWAGLRPGLGRTRRAGRHAIHCGRGPCRMLRFPRNRELVETILGGRQGGRGYRRRFARPGRGRGRCAGEIHRVALPMLRREFTIGGKVRRAVLSVSAGGSMRPASTADGSATNSWPQVTPTPPAASSTRATMSPPCCGAGPMSSAPARLRLVRRPHEPLRKSLFRRLFSPAFGAARY